MSFIAKHIVNADERIIYMARLHWICVLEGFVWFVLFWGLGIYISDWLSSLQVSHNALGHLMIGDYKITPRLSWFLYMMLGGGSVMFLTHLTKLLSTEIALTNRRIIYKTGLLFTESEEIDLHEIRAEKVKHGILGRVLNYGRVYLDCRFVGDITLPRIRKPYRFLKSMHKIDRALPAEVHYDQPR
ncbi:MAG TPA: PH domain-containing protein [Micavibrio sp.]